MNVDSIKAILSLRYDYTQNPSLPKYSWTNLQPQETFSQDELLNEIDLNLKQQIPSDYSKPISISLSGGVDSTVALCILKKIFPNNEINAISVKFSDSTDETETASKIAKTIGVNHHVIEIDNFLEKLSDAISITKLPFWDIHWYYVVEKASNLSPYLITGDGGDELFGGYVFRYSNFLSKISEKSSVNDKIHAYLDCHNRDWVPDQEHIFGSFMQFRWHDIYKKLSPYFDNPLSPLEQVFLADYNGKLLYNFSIVNNLLAQNFKIKNISPFLSSTIIKKSMKIPTEQKYDLQSNVGKLPLRKILKSFNVDNLIEKQKLGFSVNTQTLWKRFGREMVKNFLTDGKIIQDGWIKKEWVFSNLNNKNIDIRNINKLLGLLAFEIWYRTIELKNKPNLH